jgi:hypothetical protein
MGPLQRASELLPFVRSLLICINGSNFISRKNKNNSLNRLSLCRAIRLSEQSGERRAYDVATNAGSRDYHEI